MRITLARRNVYITDSGDYSMDGTSLAVKTDNPYLGVQIDNKLSWSPDSPHVNITAAKASRLTGFLWRNHTWMPKNRQGASLHVPSQTSTRVLLPYLEPKAQEGH